MTQQNTRFYSVDVLRGMAAVIVCFYHFTHTFLPDGSPMKGFFQYGYLGVESFFLISGFIIPYSFAQKNYQYKDFPTYARKRFWRIEPAYWASILLMLGMDLVASFIPGFADQVPKHTFYDVFLHIFHANALLGEPWVRDIYWTLAIDWQFYLCVCVLFPLLFHRHIWLRLATLVAFGALTPFFSQHVVFYYGFAFLIGVLFFYKTEKSISNSLFFVLAIACLSGVYYFLGATHLGAVLVSLVCLLTCHFKQPIFGYFGKISYSLYLTHIFSGWAVCSLLKLFVTNSWLMSVGIVFAVAVSVAFADVFYKKIEQRF